MPDNNTKFLSQLNEMQQQAVNHAAGPLLIVAGAGSGKTRTLTSRLICLLNSGVNPENVIAVTFTNKAANEMRNRVVGAKLLISDYSPFIGTFHSLGARILKKEAKKTGRHANFTIFDDNDSLSLIKRALKELGLATQCNPMAIATRISKIKNELTDTDELESSNAYEKIAVLAFKKYEEALLKNNAFDFDDLIEKVVRILISHPETLVQYQSQWQHVLIDEFQDVNTSQYLLVKLLCQKHKNIFAIGDDQQSIYGFRGSDFRNFLNFEKDWQNAAVVKLEENYRSTENIIRAASELIKNNKLQKLKTLWTRNPHGSLINITAFQDSENEAWGIAEKIASFLKLKQELPEHLAILYRTNAQSRAIEQAFIQLQIPYEIFGGIKFYGRKEIKDIVAGLRYAFNPKDTVSAERLIKTFSKSKSAALLQELPRLKNELSLAELINFFIEHTDYLEYLEKNFKNPEERRENIGELIQFASTFKNIQDFLERVSLLTSLDEKPSLSAKQPLKEKSPSPKVKLMTIHLAKGLEFNQVFIIGTNEGLLPHERSLLRHDDLEEERRLMYVAMTRAKQNLHISFYGLPSRFLGELPPELIEFKKATNSGEEIRDWDDETIYLE